MRGQCGRSGETNHTCDCTCNTATELGCLIPADPIQEISWKWKQGPHRGGVRRTRVINGCRSTETRRQIGGAKNSQVSFNTHLLVHWFLSGPDAWKPAAGTAVALGTSQTLNPSSWSRLNPQPCKLPDPDSSATWDNTTDGRKRGNDAQAITLQGMHP